MARVRAHQRKDGSRVRAHEKQQPRSGKRRGADPDAAATAAAAVTVGQVGDDLAVSAAAAASEQTRDAVADAVRAAVLASFEPFGDARDEAFAEKLEIAANAAGERAMRMARSVVVDGFAVAVRYRALSLEPGEPPFSAAHPPLDASKFEISVANGSLGPEAAATQIGEWNARSPSAASEVTQASADPAETETHRRLAADVKRTKETFVAELREAAPAKYPGDPGPASLTAARTAYDAALADWVNAGSHDPDGILDATEDSEPG